MNRLRFRLKPGVNDLLEIELRVEGYAPVRGQLLSIGRDEALARFPNTLTPGLCLAHAVVLRFYGKSFGQTVDVPGRIRLRRDGEHEREYAIVLLDPQTVEEHVLSYLDKSLDRRVATRVRPDRRTPIHVSLRACEGRHRLVGSLINLSETGALIEVRPEDEETFAKIPLARASFRLPVDPPAELDFGVVIRERRLKGTAIQFAIEFESDRSTDFAQQQEEVRRYVLDRQQKALSPAPSPSRTA